MTSILVGSAHCMELFLGRYKMNFHLFEQINQIKCGFIEVKNQMGVVDNEQKNKYLVALSVINSYFQLFNYFFRYLFLRHFCPYNLPHAKQFFNW